MAVPDPPPSVFSLADSLPRFQTLARLLITGAVGGVAPCLTCEAALAQSFSLGSYARANGGIDHEGNTRLPTSIVTYGRRLELGPYAQVDVRGQPGIDVDLVTSLAVLGDPFQQVRQQPIQAEINNLYAEAREVLPELSVWAGARTLLGPGIYLLQLYPLRNLNLLGGGLKYGRSDITVDFHVGTTDQAGSSFPLGRPTAVDREVFISTRSRAVATSEVSHDLGPWSWSFLFEGHLLPRGSEPPRGATEAPVEHTGGAAVAASVVVDELGERDGYVGLYARAARGLAALNVPFGRCVYDGRSATSSVSSLMVAVGSNYEVGRWALLTGAYAQHLAGTSEICSIDKISEANIVVRPQWFATDRAGLALELGYQHVALSNVDVGDSQQRSFSGNVGSASLIPFLSPLGQGSFRRPLLYIEYTIAVRDDGARQLYEPIDIRARRSWDQQFVIGVEWWLDSALIGSPF